MVSMPSNMPNLESAATAGGPPQPAHNNDDMPPHPPPMLAASSRSSSKLTPYDSLKELVKKKRQRSVLGGGGAGGGLAEGLPAPPPPPHPVGNATTHHGSRSNIVVAGQQHQQHGMGGGIGIVGPRPIKNRKIDFGMPLVAAAAAVAASSESNGDNHLQQQVLKHSMSAPSIFFQPSSFLRQQALYPNSQSSNYYHDQQHNQQMSSTSIMARNKSLSSFDAFSSNSNKFYFYGDKLERVMENDNNSNNDNFSFLNNGYNFKSDARSDNRQQLQQQLQQQPLESALHRACCRGDGVAIRRHLQHHPFDAGNASQLKTLKKRYNAMFRIVETRRFPETYIYPINLAIKYHASSDALRELARLAPQTLQLPDGPNKEISIHVLLSHLPSDLAMVDLILLKYPSVAKCKDRLWNTPLHVACRYGCPLDVVRHVCIMYPDALFCRNFHGLTPLDLANRSTSGTWPTDDVINYLWEAVAEQTEPMLVDQAPDPQPPDQPSRL